MHVVMFVSYHCSGGFSLFVVVIEFVVVCFFFKQKTAYEMRISDWSSDVCSSDLFAANIQHLRQILAMQAQRDRAYGADIGGYVFAGKAVATRRRLHQNAIFIP